MRNPWPTLRKQQVILTPGAWTHASGTTPRQPAGRWCTGPWTVTSALSGKNCSSTTGRCPGRLTFMSNVRGCGPLQLASALSFLRFAPTEPCHPRRLLGVSSLVLRKIDASTVCPSQVPRHTWCCPQAKMTVLARAQPGPWSVHVPVRSRHSAPVQVAQAQHKWATELARTSGKSLASAPLFPASSGNVATKVQVSSAVCQVARLLGMPLETLTGVRRYFGHTFRATGATYLASCGIDVWRIQLHGRCALSS